MLWRNSRLWVGCSVLWILPVWYPDVKPQLSIHCCKTPRLSCGKKSQTMGGMQHIAAFVSPTTHYHKYDILEISINAIPNNMFQVCDLENKFKGREMLLIHFWLLYYNWLKSKVAAKNGITFVLCNNGKDNSEISAFLYHWPRIFIPKKLNNFKVCVKRYPCLASLWHWHNAAISLPARF